MGVYCHFLACRSVEERTKKLIRAVVDAAKGEAPPPPELRTGWLCEQWGTLPEAGGLYDQDYQTITRATACMNIYAAYMRYRNAQGADIHRLTVSDRKILRYLKDMELL